MTQGEALHNLPFVYHAGIASQALDRRPEIIEFLSEIVPLTDIKQHKLNHLRKLLSLLIENEEWDTTEESAGQFLKPDSTDVWAKDQAAKIRFIGNESSLKGP